MRFTSRGDWDKIISVVQVLDKRRYSYLRERIFTIT